MQTLHQLTTQAKQSSASKAIEAHLCRNISTSARRIAVFHHRGEQCQSLLSDFDYKVKDVLDNTAPLRTITIKGDSLKLWYNDSIHKARQRRRLLERKAKNSGLEVHRQMLKEQTLAVAHIINLAKSRYYQDKLTTAYSKETFSVINSLMNYNAGTFLPSGSSDQTLAGDVVHFFHNKGQTIRLGLDKLYFNDITACPNLDEPVPELGFFRVQTREELVNVINSCASKTCSLDFIPTALLKNSCVLFIVLPTIIDLVNASLPTGIFRLD